MVAVVTLVRRPAPLNERYRPPPPPPENPPPDESPEKLPPLLPDQLLLEAGAVVVVDIPRTAVLMRAISKPAGPTNQSGVVATRNSSSRIHCVSTLHTTAHGSSSSQSLTSSRLLATSMRSAPAGLSLRGPCRLGCGQGWSAVRLSEG